MLSAAIICKLFDLMMVFLKDFGKIEACMQNLPVAHLFRENMVMLTDHLNMAIAVDWDINSLHAG